MFTHKSYATVAAAPDWLAAQSGHKPHGVTVMGAYRRAPSQAGSDVRSPRLASPQSLQKRVSIFCGALSNFSVLIYQRHAKTRCWWRYRTGSSWKVYCAHLERDANERTAPRMASKAVHPYRRRFRINLTLGRFSDAMPAGENTCGVEASGAGEIGISSWARAVA